jgi:hypothetical protein
MPLRVLMSSASSIVQKMFGLFSGSEHARIERLSCGVLLIMSRFSCLVV